MNHFSLSDVSAGTGCSAREYLTATPVSAYLTSPGFPYVYPRYIILATIHYKMFDKCYIERVLNVGP